MPSYILALDQGTTSSRAILFDEHSGNRHHQSKGDDHPVGCKDRQTGLQRNRLAVPQNGRPD